MRNRVLFAILGACGLIALTPVLIWLVAVVFDRVDDQLRDALALTAYSVPVALGLAAITLAVHGLLINAQVHDGVAEELDELRQSLSEPPAVLRVTVAGSPAGREAAATAVATQSEPYGSAATSRTARVAKTNRVEVGQKAKGDRVKRRAKAMARTELRRRIGF